MSGMRSLVSFLGGAVSVGLVVGVLAAAGVIDDDTAPTATEAPSPPASAPSGSSSAKPINTQPTNVSQIYKRGSPRAAGGPPPPGAPPSGGWSAKPINTQPTNVSQIYKRVSPGVVFVQSTGG